MAVELATAYVSIVPSAEGFTRRLRDQVDGPSGDAGASAGEAFSGQMGSRITQMAKVAGVALLGLGAGAAAWGLKMAGANEQAQISFETMLGSADKASVFLTQLKDFAAKTPFEFPELQTAAGSLISVGIQADKVIPIMTSLGNATSGMGTGAEGVKRATVALQQMNAAGRITAEDLNQLRDAGIPVFELLTAATGKTKEELAGMAANGKLGRQELDQLMASLESGKGLERFNGLMEKQSQSLAGLWSTLKDTIGQGLANAMAPAAESLKTVLLPAAEALTPLLGSLGSLVANVLGPILPVLTAVMGPLAQFVAVLGQGLGDVLTQLLPSLGQVLLALTPLLVPLAKLAAALIAPTAGVLAELMTALAVALLPLVSILTPVIEAFASLVKIITDNSVVMTGLLAALGGAAIASAISSVTYLAGAIGSMAATMGVSSFSAFLQVLKQSALATKAWAVIQGVFNAVMAANPIVLIGAAVAALIAGVVLLYQRWAPFHDIVDATGRALAAAFGWIKDLIGAIVSGDWSKAGDMISGLWDTIKTAVGSFLANLPGWIGSALGSLGGLLVTGFTTAFDWLVANAPAILANIGRWLLGLGGWILSTIGNLGSLLLQGFVAAFGWIVTNQTTVLAALGSWIANLPATFLGWLSSGLSFLLTFLYNAVNWVVTNGPALLTGLLGFFAGLPGRILAAIGALGSFLFDNVFVPAMLWLVDNGPTMIGNVLSFFAELPGKIVAGLGSLGGLLVDAIATAFGWLVDNGPSLVQGVIDWFAGLPAKIFGAFRDAIGTVGGAALDMGKTIYNAIAGFVNEHLVKPIKDFVVEIGPFRATPFGVFPEMPTLATGGPLDARQPAIVGEAGPELWWPNTAGTIVPNSALPAGGAGGINIGTLAVNSRDDAHATAFAIRSELRFLTMAAA